MKRLASLAVMGAIALGSIVAAANAAPIIPSSSSQMDPNCRTAGATTAIGPTMDIGPTGGLIMVAGTIRIGVTGISTGTDAESENKAI